MQDPNSGKIGTAKGKPGPKPKKSISDSSEVQDKNIKVDGLPSKGRKSSSERTDEIRNPPKSRSSPKPKKETSDIVGEHKKKPGPKPRKALSEPLKTDLSSEDAAKAGAKVSRPHGDTSKVTTSSQSSKNKPCAVLKKHSDENSENGREISKQSKDSENSSSQIFRAKPGPKPKKKTESSTNIDSSPVSTKKKVISQKVILNNSVADDSNTEEVGKIKASKSKNSGTSSPSSKLPTKSKNAKTDTSPIKGKPGPKPKAKLSPTKLTNGSPKRPGKKVKKTGKRPSSLNATERQSSTSDESDTLYSLNEPERKKFKFDQTDSGTSSDSEVVLRKPKETKTSPSPRKMLLKDSIRPKNIDNVTGEFKMQRFRTLVLRIANIIYV